MEQKHIKVILKLKEIREGIPQFVFFEDIFPPQDIKVRKEILLNRKRHPEIDEIDFILNSPGGLPDDAYRIIRTLRKNYKIVNIIVPFWAKSASTLLTLGGSKIIMDEFAEFGPLDVQVGKAREDSPEYDRESALNDEFSVKIIQSMYKEMYESMYIRIYEHTKINIPKTEVSNQLLGNLSEFFKPLLQQINPYKLGEKRRLLDIAAQYANRILIQFNETKDQSNIRRFVDFLVNLCPDHGYIIDYDIIAGFLENVFTADIYGPEYKSSLSELSMMLCEDYNDSIKFIGFIDEAMLKTETNNNNEQQSLTNDDQNDTFAEKNEPKADTEKHIDTDENTGIKSKPNRRRKKKTS